MSTSRNQGLPWAVDVRISMSQEPGGRVTEHRGQGPVKPAGVDQQEPPRLAKNETALLQCGAECFVDVKTKGGIGASLLHLQQPRLDDVSQERVF